MNYGDKQAIRNSFLSKFSEAKKQRETLIQAVDGMKTRILEWGTIPMAVIIPQDHITKVSKQNVQTNSVYQTFGIADTILRLLGTPAAFMAAVSTPGTVVVTAALSSVFPPLILVSLVLATTSFLVCQQQKNIELLNTSEMIFNICQNMISDLTRMLIFYARIEIKDPKIKNPFIPLTMDKLTQLQISIINLCDPEVLQYIAISYGIIDNFDGIVLKPEIIFGKKGIEFKCNTEHAEPNCEEIKEEEEEAPDEENIALRLNKEKKELELEKGVLETKINELNNRQQTTSEITERKHLHDATDFVLNFRSTHKTFSETQLSLITKLKNQLDNEISTDVKLKQQQESDKTYVNRIITYEKEQKELEEPKIEKKENSNSSSTEPDPKQSSIEASGRTFSKIKRAIIARLNYKVNSRQFKNLFAPGERLREVIRDTTIVGIFFSQASARFSLDALEKQQEWIETQSKMTSTEAVLVTATNQVDIVAAQVSATIEKVKMNPYLYLQSEEEQPGGAGKTKRNITRQRFNRGKT